MSIPSHLTENGSGTTGEVTYSPLSLHFKVEMIILRHLSEGNPLFVAFMKKNYPPNFTYAAFAEQFRAEFFNPNSWAEVLQSSGAKYVFKLLTNQTHNYQTHNYIKSRLGTSF